jgi:hypothetical protein
MAELISAAERTVPSAAGVVGMRTTLRATTVNSPSAQAGRHMPTSTLAL